MKNVGRVLAAGALGVVVASGCGGAKEEAKSPAESQVRAARAAPVAPVDLGAREKFNAALDALNGHDKANDWNDQACADTAKQFLAAASANSSGKFPEATYDAGLAYQ